MNTITCTCPIHGLNLRPDRCHDCARIPVRLLERPLRIEECDRNRLFGIQDGQGRIQFKLLGRPLDNSKMPLFRD